MKKQLELIGEPYKNGNYLVSKIKDSRLKRGYRLKMKLVCEEKTKTLQSEKEKCDINNIIAKHKLRSIPIVQPQYIDTQYGDFSNIPDYQDAVQVVIDSQYAFNQLPSGIRKRFGNDPLQMIEFCQDNANYEEALKLGLVDKKVEQVDPPVPTPNSNAGNQQNVPNNEAQK